MAARYGSVTPFAGPRRPRPSRAWFWVGGALIPLCLGIAVLMFVSGVLQALSPPDFVARTQGTRPATFTVDADRHPEPDWLLYSSPPTADHTACTLSGPDGTFPAFRYPTFDHRVADAERSWAMTGMTRLDEPGEYTLTCRAPGNVSYGIAYADTTTGPLIGLVGTLSALLFAPFAGVMAGVIIIIVTAVRRSGHPTRPLPTHLAAPPERSPP
ncbi:hypothetical protein, partial [Nocardiopsis sp. MG754419]|uniref:hypothetical protein n=1 Tax=Nocardiopsis sp. MG754419 TaxID=2259865 RepID=UPI001BAA8212